MPRDRLTPTPELQQQICAFIRAGGYPRVAAEAAGVPARVFARWLRRGRGKRAPAVYRAFADAVAQATAQGRLAAELQVFEKRPLDWLQCGPGKETRSEPGWSSTPKPATGQEAAGRSPLEDPEFQALVRRLLDGLASDPEARAKVAELIQEPPKSSGRRR
jgi:hypothetical protein